MGLGFTACTDYDSRPKAKPSPQSQGSRHSVQESEPPNLDMPETDCFSRSAVGGIASGETRSDCRHGRNWANGAAAIQKRAGCIGGVKKTTWLNRQLANASRPAIVRYWASTLSTRAQCADSYSLGLGGGAWSPKTLRQADST